MVSVDDGGFDPKEKLGTGGFKYSLCSPLPDDHIFQIGWSCKVCELHEPSPSIVS